jgi:hypothetical protein
VSGLTAGSVFYLKVSGADTSVFGTGKYALGLNMGSGCMPPIPVPTTTTANGNPLSGGGGHAAAISPELQANTYASDTQQAWAGGQTVASDALGNFVVTWSSHNQDGSGWGVYAQRYSMLGLPLGGEFRVNSTTNNDQQYPAVAMDAVGDFVIVWTSNGQDGNGNGVYAQLYCALGTPIGGEFQVNTFTADNQMYPCVAMDKLGDFTVTWSSHNQDGAGWGIYAQRFSLLGLRLGGEFQVNSTTAGDQEYSDVAMDLAGDSVITWSSNKQDGDGWGVYGQRYSTLGLPVGGEFKVNSTTKGDQLYPAAAMDGDGNFVVTWSSKDQDGSGWGVYAQMFSLAGITIGGEFRANATTAGDQQYSSIAMDTLGNFIITWSSNNQDGNGWGVYLQQYSVAGAPLGNEVRVNSTTSGNQQFSAATMNAAGYAAVAWSGAGTGDNSGVFAQQYFIGSSALNALGVGDFFTINSDDDVSSTQMSNGTRASTSENSHTGVQAPVPSAPVPGFTPVPTTTTGAGTFTSTSASQPMFIQVGNIAKVLAQRFSHSPQPRNADIGTGFDEPRPIPNPEVVDGSPAHNPEPLPAVPDWDTKAERPFEVCGDIADWMAAASACFAKGAATDEQAQAAVTSSAKPPADSAAALLAVATLGFGLDRADRSQPSSAGTATVIRTPAKKYRASSES